jgi:hypothetical protein
MLAILSHEHHGTTASSSSRSANPISNPAHPENTVNVPVGTPAPRSAMVSKFLCLMLDRGRVANDSLLDVSYSDGASATHASQGPP